MSIAVAIAGQAAAYTLLSCAQQDGTLNWGLAFYIPVLLLQLTFWGLLAACRKLSTRRVRLSGNGQSANTAE